MSSSKTFLQGLEICSGNIYLFSANGKRQDGFCELEKREFLMACVSVCVCVLSHFSHVGLFATLRTVAHQAPLFMGFSRQEHWNG